MNTKILVLLCWVLLLNYVFAKRISELKCDETSSLRTDPRSLYPYLIDIVAIDIVATSTGTYCYGVLLSEYYVLSSYPCSITPPGVEIKYVRKLIVDGEQYSDSNLFAVKDFSRNRDNLTLSLFQLNEPISYSNKISIFRPACLWTNEVLPSATYSIYGKELKLPEKIIQLLVRIKPGIILSDEDCIKHQRIFNDFKTICMNTTGKIIYSADGGPIEAKVGNRNYIVAIVRITFNTYPDSTHLGNLISPYITWIENTVWPNETVPRTQFNCGKRKILHKPLMTYSQPTYHGEYPWHVALYKVQGGRQQGFEYICGGSIIDKKTIVTAAHCVHDERGILPPNRLLIIAGTHNLNVIQIETKTFIVNNITVHEDYNLEFLENDIALLKLSNSIKYTKYIRPICLGNELHFENMTEGIVAGWGVNELHQPSDILLQATLPIRNNIECRQSNRPVFNTYLNDNNYCAGSGNGTSVCSGDSGGGMIFEDNSQWYLRGIVSLGVALPMSNRCDMTQMVLFTDVSKYYYWITRYMSENN